MDYIEVVVLAVISVQGIGLSAAMAGTLIFGVLMVTVADLERAKKFNKRFRLCRASLLILFTTNLGALWVLQTYFMQHS